MCVSLYLHIWLYCGMCNMYVYICAYVYVHGNIDVYVSFFGGVACLCMSMCVVMVMVMVRYMCMYDDYGCVCGNVCMQRAVCMA